MPLASLLAKKALKLFHGSSKNFDSFDPKFAKETAFGKGFSFTPDEKIAKNYADLSPKEIKKLWGTKYVEDALERKKDGTPVLYAVEANIDNSELLLARKNFNSQDKSVQAKINKLIKEEKINKDNLDLDKPKFWRQLIKESGKSSDDLFPKYKIKAILKDATDSKLKQVGGDLEYTVFDPKSLKIVNKVFLKKEGKEMQKREEYVLGGVLAKGAAKLGQKVSKKLDEMQGVDAKTPGRTSEDRGVVVGKDRTKAYKTTEQIKGAAKGAAVTGLLSAGASKSWNEENEDKPETKKEASEFEKAFSKAHNAGQETFMFKGKEYTTEVRKGKNEGGLSKAEEDEVSRVIAANKILNSQSASKEEKERASAELKTLSVEAKKEAEKRTGSKENMEQEMFPRNKKQKGGSMLLPTEMEEMPVDTYTPEEQANAEDSQVSDEQMEDEYMDWLIDQSLNDTEQEYLMNALEADPKLSEIFDKVSITASEFSGAGKVEGPGTGVSDSIPARLSDGEFVITEKATKEIGADNLQQMMDAAERKADGGQATRKAIGGLLSQPENFKDSMDDEEEIEQTMLSANQSPSLRGSRGI